MLTLGGLYSPGNLPATEDSSKTVKLFGQTLKVYDSRKVSWSSTTEDTAIHLNAAPSAKEKVELKVENSHSLIIPDREPNYAFGFFQESSTALSGSVPPQFGMNKEHSDAGVVSGCIPLRALFRGMVFPQVSSMAAADSLSFDKRDQETEPRKEGLISNSNSGIEEHELKEKTFDIESKARSKALKKRSSPAKKGFVPYKRRVSPERDSTSPKRHEKKGFVPYKRCVAPDRDATSPKKQKTRDFFW